MKAKIPSVMHARYLVGEEASIPGYVKIRDRFHDKDLLGRFLPKMSKVEEALTRWSQLSHPCFAQIFRYLEMEQKLLAIMRPLEEDAVPLRALNSHRLRNEVLADIFLRLVNAYCFLSAQNLFIPYLDLSKIYYHEAYPVRILGHEASVTNRSPRQDDQMTTLDIRYNAPEMVNRRARTPKSDVYHLGALFYHFLSGRVAKPYDDYEPIGKRRRTLRRAWDDLLERMMRHEPSARPDWETLWRDACESLGINGDADRLGPVWLGVEDRRTLEALKDSLVKAKDKPQALALQVYPGREKIQRLAPFSRFAEAQGYFVFQSWTSERETRHFKIINDFLGMLKEGVVRHINRPDLESELKPLSEWQSAEELIAKWRVLLRRVLRNIVPRYGAGIVLIIEDIQHLDRGSLETLGYLFSWLGEMPFVLAVTGNTFAHPHFGELARAWRHDWRWLHPSPLSEERLNALRWQPDNLAVQEETRLALRETNREEALALYWLEDRARRPGLLAEHLTFQWRCFRNKERLILDVLSCTTRALDREDLERAFDAPRLRTAIEKLLRYRLILDRGDGGLAIAAAVMTRFCQERMGPEEIAHIRQRLFEYELSLDQPDLVQAAYLAWALRGVEAMEGFETQLMERVHRRFELEPLWRLEAIADAEDGAVFGEFAAFARLLRGFPAPRGTAFELRAVHDLSRANRAKELGDYERALKVYHEMAGRRGIEPGLKAHALALAAECRGALGDRLAVGRYWRRFRALDREECDPAAVRLWAARIAAALAAVGSPTRDIEPLLADAPRHLAHWPAAHYAWKSGEYKEAVELLQTALPKLRRTYDLNWRGAVFMLYGKCLHRNYRAEDAIQAYRSAEACFRKTGNLREIEGVRFNLAVAEKLAGRFASAEHRFIPIYEKAQAAGDEDTMCRAAFNLMVCAMCRNEMDRFERLRSEHRRLAKRIKSDTERARGLTMALHAALIQSRDEVEENATELRKLLPGADPDPLLAAEAEVALRLADLALGRPDSGAEAHLNEFTRWRHRFLDALYGKNEDRFDELLERIKDGYFRAVHFFLLHCAVDRRYLPRKYCNERLAEAFQSFVVESGAQYMPFLKRCFGHLRMMGDVPRQAWEQALQVFESVQWREAKQDGLKTELVQNFRQVWPFVEWGACLRAVEDWRPVSAAGAAAPPDEVSDHLQRLKLTALESPLITTLTLPDDNEIKSLLLLPVQPRGKTGLVWFLNERAAAHDLGNHFQPLFRFYAKLFEGLLTGEMASVAAERVHTDKSFDLVDESYGIVGESRAIREILVKIKRYAPSSLNIYIYGETGSGKELAARGVHLASQRANRPFRAINCSHFPDTLVESELFGHVRGAFTGAANDKAGLLELVDGGTLFLDEVGDINAKVQSLLLRVLQEGEFSRIGENRVRKVDIRFITATNKNLHQMIDRGQFRGDLYYRMVEEEIDMPPLRERTGDLPLLADHFAQKHDPGRRVAFSGDFFERMRRYDWPGNVREFESYIRKTLVRWPGREAITGQECLPFLRDAAPESPDRELTLAEFEERNRIRLIRERLARYDGVRTKAAESLRISRQQLVNLISKYNLD